MQKLRGSGKVVLTEGFLGRAGRFWEGDVMGGRHLLLWALWLRRVVR